MRLYVGEMKKSLLYYIIVGILLVPLGVFAENTVLQEETATEVSYLAWYDQDDVLVKSATEGEFYAKFGIVNETDKDREVRLIIAVYTAPEGCVKYVCDSSATVKANSCGTYQTQHVTKSSKEVMRAFAWEGVRPLNESAEDLYLISPEEAEKRESLSRMYAAIDEDFLGVFDWLAELYDPASGGFYTTVSGAKYEGYTPSIESTVFIYNMLSGGELGATESIPAEIKQKIINFVLDRQSPADGFFYDRDAEGTVVYSREDYTDRDRIRLYSIAVNFLISQGVTPRYSAGANREVYLAQSGDASAFPDYCASVDTFMNYIRSQDWDHASWTAGDNTQQAANYLKIMDEEKAQPYKDALMEFLNQRQDVETGYWAKTGDYGFNAVSGAFKVAAVYHGLYDMCVPNPEKVLESVAVTLKTADDKPNTACYVRNPISLMEYIQLYRPELIKKVYGKIEDEIEFVSAYEKYIKDFMSRDGAAGSKIYGAAEKFGGIPTGLALCEGDADGTRQMSLTRRNLRLVFGHRVDNTMFRPLYESFWNKIAAKTTIVKQKFDLNGGKVTEDFEGYAVNSKIYGGLWSGYSDAVVVEKENGNKFITVTDRSTVQTELLQLSFPKIYQTGSISCKIRFKRIDSYSKLDHDYSYCYLRICDEKSNIIEVDAVETGGSTFRLAAVSSMNPKTFQSLQTGLPDGEWIDFKVDFTIQSDKTMKVTYWINGTHITKMDDCYTKTPCGAISRLGFVTSPRRRAQISVDDICVTGK